MYIWIHLSPRPIHYECWIEIRPSQKLKSQNYQIKAKSVSEHCAYFGTKKFETIPRIWTTISQKLKIEKLIFHSFQNIAQLFGPKKNQPFLRGGGVVCMSLTRTGPKKQNKDGVEFNLISPADEYFSMIPCPFCILILALSSED